MTDAASSSKLGDFVLNLSKDASLVQKLRTEPEKTLEAAGLSETEKKAILDGDTAAIRQSLSGHPQVFGDTVVVVVVAVFAL